MTDAAAWEALLLGFSPAFTSASLPVFQQLATAWVLCVGRRVVTRIYQVAEPMGHRAHDAYHRFLREGAWFTSELWKLLALKLVAAFYAHGTIPLDIDDTLFHKAGRKIRGAAWWRDAVRSSGQKVVHAFGLNLLVLTLRVEPPWGGEPIGLPINMRLHRKGGPGLLELTKELMREVAAWFPDRHFHLCGDGFFASLAGASLPRCHLTSRMRRDAALYRPAPKPRKRRRGRPRKKGARLPTPEGMAKSTKGWRLVDVQERGKTRPRLILSRIVLWYAVCGDQPILFVISRDPKGKEHDDFFFTTDLSLPPEDVISIYAGRWCIEDTFKNVKQLLGGEDPQTWRHKGPERAAALSFWLYSLVWYWYLTTQGARPSLPRLPWYTKKCTPSFADAMASLRRALWRQRIFAPSGNTAQPRSIVGALVELLAYAA